MPKTKLLFTLGPATDQPGVLGALLAAGMNGARLNFSHGTQADHAQRFKRLHAEARRIGSAVATLLDLSGPKLRVGAFPQGKFQLTAGEMVRVVPDGEVVGVRDIPISYPHLSRDVRPGGRILLDDGLLELKVRRIKGAAVECEVVTGGYLLDHKGFNVPEAPLSVPALTPKDLADLRFGLKLGVDLVALSFVRRPDEIRRLKRLVEKSGSGARVIAKLEKPQAIEHLEEIILAADGVMVARGDLGVEMTPEQVPLLQKRIIMLANQHNRLVITATQMLQSMMENPAPTRAEASDVANAIFDGTDAVMLSGETATGKYPVEAACMMARIAGEAERSPQYNRLSTAPAVLGPDDALVEAAVKLAHNIQARALVVFTQTGNTARLVSRRRPQTPQVVFAHSLDVQRQLNLNWGIHSLLIKNHLDTEGLLHTMVAPLLKHRYVKPGDTVIVLASSPVASRSHVNFLKVQKI
ncbi:MAG: pyruvate kinase [Candidatus Firestonebacteria bacterium]|nr:pyruvate kinase [Candidatus Firestonebacteria bacterium]